MTSLNVYVGFDHREVEAYELACYTLKKNSSIPLNISPLIQDDLRKSLLYWREKDVRASTDFSLTRFLTAYLNNYEGWALFVDCDVLFLGDVAELLELADPKYSLMCVHHKYEPKAEEKMFGASTKNYVYPRKNWSSVMLFNCYKNKELTLNVVNNERPSYLHQMKWLKDEQIGELDKEWNFLVGEYENPDSVPMLAHYTLGTPNLVNRPDHCRNEMFDKIWFDLREEMLNVNS